MARVAVVGSCNIDLVCFTERMPKPGETITGSSFMTCFGGKGANQAVMAGKLCGEVFLVARVGDDSFGEDYINNLKENGVISSHVLKTDNVCTGTATIIVDKSEGENCIIVVPGANGCLSVADIDKHLPDLLPKVNVLVCQMEVDREVTKRSLILAKQANVLTIFNPAPAHADIEKEFFQNTDILCCNESEAEILTGLSFQMDEGIISQMIKSILSLGCRCVVLTLGKNGARFALASNPSKVYECSTEKKDIKVVDTTGAGDAFIGTLASLLSTSLLQNVSLDDCINEKLVSNAVKVASFTVTRKGAQASYPKPHEIKELF